MTLAVEPGFLLPEWFKIATPQEVGEALSKGAAEIQRSKDDALQSSTILLRFSRNRCKNVNVNISSLNPKNRSII